MNVLAFDPDSLTTGICFYSDGVYHVTASCPGETLFDQIENIFSSVNEMVLLTEELIAFVEKPNIWIHGKSSHKDIINLACQSGICAGISREFALEVHFVSPTQWKGQRPKLIHQKFLCDQLGWEYTERAGYVSIDEPHAKNLVVLDPPRGYSWWKHALDAVGIAHWAVVKMETP